MQCEASGTGRKSRVLGRYLSRLRKGYGYSLKAVEDRARGIGFQIDRSLLCRYENGRREPSFQRLCGLARIYGVPIQLFSDVLEMPKVQTPETGDVEDLVARGNKALERGEYHVAHNAYRSALNSRPALDPAMATRVRIKWCNTLWRLGKLTIAERELLRILRGTLNGELRARAMLNLAIINNLRGDSSVGELTAGRACDLARTAGFPELEACAITVEANALKLQRRFRSAIKRYLEAVKLHEANGRDHGCVLARISIGSCYVEMGRYTQGIRILRGERDRAKQMRFDRLQTTAWSNLGEAYFHLENHELARASFAEAESLTRSRGDDEAGVLFHSTFYQWQMALREGNATTARIAIGRLKLLRPGLQEWSTEVEAFDGKMEKEQDHA